MEKKKPGRPKKAKVETPVVEIAQTSEEVLSAIGIELPEVEVSGVGWVGSPVQVVPETLKNAPQGEKSKHPYEYEVRRPNDVPDAFRDDAYAVCEAKIDAFLQRCWDIDTPPVINGLMIGRKV